MEPEGEPQSGPDAFIGGKELTLSQIELVERVGWLIDLRWLAFAGVTATIVIARQVFSSRLPWTELFATALTIALYNLACQIAWRRVRTNRAGNLKSLSVVLANVQITCDLLVLGALIHFSGGVENLFGFYFVFHMVIASVLLSRRAAFAQATLAVAIFVTVALGEYEGWLSHYMSPIGMQFPVLHSSPIVVLAAVWVMATSLYVTVYFATSIVSRLRQREDEVTSLSNDLRSAADRLQTAYDKLAETERAKSAYARKVAHELRSPLAAIESLLRVVVDGLHGEVPQPVLDTIGRARSRTHALLDLVRDLLALAAAKEAPRSAEWVVCDLSAMVATVTGLLSSRAEPRGITITQETLAELSCVKGDREQLEELLTNLIGNAIKYSLEGGVVDVRLSEDAASVVLVVTDRGIGIAEDDLPHVFDDFYRSQDARKYTSEGTGLGLSIARTIVEAHNGTITVDSQLGKGTTFTVRLPRQT